MKVQEEKMAQKEKDFLKRIKELERDASLQVVK
jgi:hypothetical protein